MAYSPSPAPRRRRLVRRASKSPESSPNRGRRNRRYSSTPPSNRRITIPSSSPPLVAARRRLSSTPPRRRRSESPPLSRRLFRRDPRSVSPKSGDRTPNTLSSRQYGAQRGDRWRGDTPIPDTCFSSSPPYTPRSQRTTDLSDDDSQGDNLLPGPSTVRPEGQATPVVRWCWEFSYEAGGYVRREYVHTSELTPEGSLCDYEEDVQEGGQTPLTLRRFLEEDDEGDMPVGYDAWNLPSPSARSVENILASDTGITTQYDAPSPTPSSSRRSWTPSEEIEEHLDEVEEPRKPIKPRKRKIRRIPPPVECNSNPPPNHKLLEINGENFTGSRRNASAYKQYKTFEKNLKGSNGEWRSAMACMKDVGRTKDSRFCTAMEKAELLYKHAEVKLPEGLSDRYLRGPRFAKSIALKKDAMPDTEWAVFKARIEQERARIVQHSSAFKAWCEREEMLGTQKETDSGEDGLFFDSGSGSGEEEGSDEADEDSDVEMEF